MITVDEFEMLLNAADLKWSRAEISKTKGGRYEASVRIGRAFFSGEGLSSEAAVDATISAAQLSKPWA